MLVDGRPLDQAAREYQDEIIEVLGLPARLDLLLIGMGPDGHVGSLFPAHPAVDERERLVVAVDDAPKPPPQRLTMTLPLMAWARSICLAAFGREKAGAVREVVDDSDSRLPAALVLRGHADAACLLDADAATLLRTT